MTVANRLKIGDVAKQTEVSVSTLRYYEDLGLVQSERGDNGYRYFAATAVQQVQFIKKAQTLGFSLDDIGEVLNVHRRGAIPCDFVQSLLNDKIQQLESQIQHMIAFKAELEQYRDRWSDHHLHPSPDEICPLIETVSL